MILLRNDFEMKMKMKLSEYSVCFLKKIVELDAKVSFSSVQIRALICFVENKDVASFISKVRVGEEEYLGVVEKKIDDVTSKSLTHNNPWHRLGWLIDSMSWGKIPDYLNDSESRIWGEIQTFTHGVAPWEDVRLKILLLIMIEFGGRGVLEVSENLYVIFGEPIYLTFVDGLPSIHFREAVTVEMVKVWLKRNKDFFNDSLLNFGWKKNTREKLNFVRDIQIVLMKIEGNKDLTIARKFKITEGRVQQVLKGYLG
jgi:hypothetical protein